MERVNLPHCIKQLKRLLFFLFLLCAFRSAVHAAVTDRWNCDRLHFQGIDCHRFKIVDFSGDGSTLIGLERVKNLQLRMKGFVWALKVFGLDARGRATGVKSFLIPCYMVEDSAISDDGKTVVLFGDEGTKILKVDLNSGEVSSIFKKTAGQPGFSPTTRVWFAEGHFFIKGYFYDSKGYLLNNGVVQLNLSNPNDPKLFKSTWNLDETYHAIGKPVSEALISGNEGFLIGTDGKKQTLYYYLDGKLSPIDSEKEFGPMGVAKHRVLYTYQLDPQHMRSIVKDLETGKNWILSPDAGVVLPYLSRTGRMAVFGMADSKFKFSYYFAREDNEFKLEPIPELLGTMLQVLRFSADGRRFASQSPSGFVMESIP